VSDDIDDVKCHACGSDQKLDTCSNCDRWFCSKCVRSWVTADQNTWGVTCEECVDNFERQQGGGP
jgi:hypothetical protein